MKRIALTTAAAFCVTAGFVFGEFVRAVRPVDYLIRPLAAAAVFSVLVGLAASVFRQWSIPVAAVAIAWFMQPWSSIAVWSTAVFAGLLAYRLITRRTPALGGPLLAAALVFAVAGLVPIVPLISWTSPARADVEWVGPPQYAVLLDAYPRADTLASYGLDIGPFLAMLEDRGFTVYEDATSKHDATFDTLTELLHGHGASDSIPAQRETRETWRLPDGWHVIAPPGGLATIPHAPTLNPGGFTSFEDQLLARTVAAPILGDLVLAGYRAELGRALELLASTERQRVFAHIFAPHHPTLYNADGTPYRSVCYPACPPEGELGATGGYIEWLNGQIIDVVDSILDRSPDAEIVLFSDHGGRFDPDDRAEWHRVFLASRTPTRPDLFADSPHPRFVLDLLDG